MELEASPQSNFADVAGVNVRFSPMIAVRGDRTDYSKLSSNALLNWYLILTNEAAHGFPIGPKAFGNLGH